MSEPHAVRVAESAARRSYGRLLAVLATSTRDIASAEDALAEAFASALATWPVRGVPENPEGWLVTAARNKIKNHFRHHKVTDAAAIELTRRLEQGREADIEFPDERLKLLFVCAHPAIEEAVRTPLMLQVVLGLDAARIASSFVVAPKTMGQRLVRAKTKIRDAGLRFAVPDSEELPHRLSDVLATIYAAYGAGWEVVPGANDAVRDLADEALFLGRLMVALMPEEPEAKGLLSLMLFCESRRSARRTAGGVFVPLDQQNPALWDQGMVMEAERLLTSASERRRFGRFQCEAAIQSVHVQRAITGTKNHEALRTLYQLLLALAPSLGVEVGWAAVLLEGGDAHAALAALSAVSAAHASTYQPYWVTQACVHEQLGDADRAREAFARAIGLTEDASVRTFLTQRAAALTPPRKA
ncbi:MAG: hypothetical protein KA712_02170 [Myxococcales bacterium]|nr:hypothetical protein [Myxococcales bacterium]